MADPLVEAFDLFDEQVRLSAAQRRAAESRGRHVSQLLSQSDQILGCRLVGSIVRSTAVRRFSDVDILAIFDPKNEDNQQTSGQFLDLTARLAISFSNVVAQTSTTVSLQYSDWPRVDIIPALAITNDGKREVFRIPSGVRVGWQLYFPNQHDRVVRDANERLGRRFKIIVRAIKWWNGLGGEILQSYEIEELINNLFDAEIPEYPEAIHSTFNAMMQKLDDVGSRRSWGNMGGDSPSNLRTAWLLSRQIQELAIEGANKREIKGLLRRLFGEQFPVLCS